MSELYPADEELNALSGTTDGEQDVPFLTIGESPYYTSFYKMLYRLLDVARRAGDLRVHKDGALTFGVRAGKFLNGSSAVAFPGASGQALTDNATNSVYLAADGTLTVSTSGFPDPSTTPHLPLAAIETASGEYAHGDITDLRGRAIYHLAAGLSAGLSNAAAAFFAGTDLTGAEAETLTDCSNADALHVHGSAGLEAMSVTTDKLYPRAVDTDQLELGAVTTGTIAAKAVGATELSDEAVETQKIHDGAVTEAKLGTGSVTSAKLASDAVTSAKLADGAIEGDATPKLGGNLDVSDKTITTSVANGKIVLAPNGTGAVQADASGDARGQYANDLQRVRSSANQVASGNYGVICGGQNNRISAGTHGVILGGSNGLVNQNYAIAGGQSCSAQGTAAVSLGSSNLVSGSYGACPGGVANVVSGYAAFGMGIGAEAKLRGQIAHASDLFGTASGDAQYTRCIMRRAVSAAATGDALVLTLDGAAPGSGNRRTVDASHFTGVRIHLTGVSTNGAEAVSWTYHAAIKRDGSNNTVLVGSPTKISEMKTGTLGVADPTISADDTNEALQVAVSAHATLNFRWVAVVEANEIQYG
jgi:hypothetical protein